MKQLTLLALAVFLGACSDDSTKARADRSEKSFEKTKTVKLYTWVDYFEPRVLEQFKSRTGIDLEISYYDTTEEMVAAMQSDPGKFDVVVTDDITVSHLRDLSLIRSLNHADLDHFANIDSKFRNLEFDKGNEFSVPYMWGSTLVAFRKDKIPNPEKSWSILWNPEYKGRVMMLDEAQDIFGITLLKEGRSADSADSDSIKFAKAKVMEQIQSVDVRFGGLGDALDGLAEGEVWVAMNYSGDVAAMIEDSPLVDFFIPDEGALLWLDNFVISRDSENVDAAHRFIDFMMEAEVAAANSNYVWYASPNRAAEPYLDEELTGDERLYPPKEVMAKCQFPTPEIQAKREHLLNLAMRDIRKLRREMDEEKETVSELGKLGALDQSLR